MNVSKNLSTNETEVYDIVIGCRKLNIENEEF